MEEWLALREIERDSLGESASALKGLGSKAKEEEAKSGRAGWLQALIRSGIGDKSEAEVCKDTCSGRAPCWLWALAG